MFTFEQKLELKKSASANTNPTVALSFEEKAALIKRAYNPTQGLTGGALRAQQRHMREGTELGQLSRGSQNIINQWAGRAPAGGPAPIPKAQPAAPAGPSAASAGMKAPAAKRSGGQNAVDAMKSTAQAAGGALKNFDAGALGRSAISGFKDSFNGFSQDPLGAIGRGVMGGAKALGGALRGAGLTGPNQNYTNRDWTGLGLNKAKQNFVMADAGGQPAYQKPSAMGMPNVGPQRPKQQAPTSTPVNDILNKATGIRRSPYRSLASSWF